ncbi:diguanylate phosphodiesterase [Afipia sp. Root123D2]|uniref:EAL domain-containing protein n=1 Tax=Afipia sp. Root123D2 TaxID=1736436 RepID=UPI0006F5C5DF|nr:EAL domain-containing protein [Afipia sp. Root123D2]KQW21126.1 diguanylate phosphodiesterase [Afipia sp. Root123D2]
MIRISTIFIAICMVLIAASLGLILYSVAGWSVQESGLVALAALTFLILYNAVSLRMRDRANVGNQIADLSRGTTDLARQISEYGRRLAAIETRVAAVTESGSADRLRTITGEIGELGMLVKHLADQVASQGELLSGAARQERYDDADHVHATNVAVPRHAEMPAEPQPVRSQPVPSPAINDAEIVSAVRNAIAANRIDLYLQPMVTLPQRKVRFYEAVSRLRDDNDQLLPAADFIGPAESAGLMGQIDYMVLFRCVQVLRRLMVRSKDVGVFCNISAATLGNAEVFAQCLDFLETNRVLAPSLVLEFKQDTFRHLGPLQSEHLGKLARLGYRFSIDNVSDLRIDGRELADRGVGFIKVPAKLLLDPQLSTADIHASDLSGLLQRFGINLIAEKIEGERAVVDLLDYDVRLGQGFLFSAPRPLRPEGTAPAESAAQGKPASAPPRAVVSGAIKADASPEDGRLTGNAALARRAAQS